MPNFPWPSRRDASVTGDPSLAALLAWAQFPQNAAPEMRRVGEILAALTAGPADDELTGETAALAAYRNRPGVPRPVRGARRRRRRPLFPALSAKAAAAVAAAVLGFAALATAAYTGVLPAPVQRLAHVIIGAPSARGELTTGSSQVSPNGATGGNGAGGGNGASGRPTGASPTGRAHPSPTPRATGQPSTQSTPQDSGQPSTQPTPQDSGTPTPTHSKGKPTTHPTPHGSGKPTSHPTPHQ